MAMPDRYIRNASTLSEMEQACLASARVLLVGLGGLGGAVLEQLLRLGVGHIVGADGDVFEASNLNRQLLATEHNLGQAKADAAAARAAEVNPLVRFTPMARFLTPSDLPPLVASVDVVIDALGGLRLRQELQQAAAKTGKPLVTAGIAGLTGWVAVVRPGERGPADLLQYDPATRSVEEQLGNLAPVAMLAASLQASETVKLLTGRPAMTGMLLFDLGDLSFYPVQF